MKRFPLLLCSFLFSLNLLGVETEKNVPGSLFRIQWQADADEFEAAGKFNIKSSMNFEYEWKPNGKARDLTFRVFKSQGKIQDKTVSESEMTADGCNIL